jgi:isoleucyl-tRNA synthetase
MELSTKFDAKAIESQVREYIKTIDLEKQIFASDEREKIRFIEGPPTMNGIPHAGHLRGRVIKDLWYRFNTLQGKKIIFNGGWDTQGLPVELQVEKELGVTGGKSVAIKEFGIERIVSECKDRKSVV